MYQPSVFVLSYANNILDQSLLNKELKWWDSSHLTPSKQEPKCWNKPFKTTGLILVFNEMHMEETHFNGPSLISGKTGTKRLNNLPILYYKAWCQTLSVSICHYIMLISLASKKHVIYCFWLFSLCKLKKSFFFKAPFQRIKRLVSNLVMTPS